MNETGIELTTTAGERLGTWCYADDCLRAQAAYADYSAIRTPTDVFEHDEPETCDGCGRTLHTRLSERGVEYVATYLADAFNDAEHYGEHVPTWLEQYPKAVASVVVVYYGSAGCLPDAEPMAFGSRADALEYVREQWQYAYGSTPSSAEAAWVDAFLAEAGSAEAFAGWMLDNGDTLPDPEVGSLYHWSVEPLGVDAILDAIAEVSA